MSKQLYQRNHAQFGDALALLRSLPDCCTPLIFFDPQHRDVLDKLRYGDEGARQKARAKLPAMTESYIDACCRESARVLRPSAYLMLWCDTFCIGQALNSQARTIRRSLTEWARHCGFEPALHHLLLIRNLERVATGDIDRLAVFMPPGSAKSTYSSILFPPWFLGQKPEASVLAASHTTELAENGAAECAISSPSTGRYYGLPYRVTVKRQRGRSYAISTNHRAAVGPH